MKEFYLQVQSDGTITDAITNPYEDYVKFEAEQLPIGVYGGWWKLEDGKLVEYPELKPKDENEELEELRNNIADLWEVILLGGDE